MTPEQIKEARDWLDTLTRYKPGPWRVYEDKYVTAKLGYIVADLLVYDGDPSREDTANARLIVAAPDLRDRYATALDAIERLQKQVHSLDHALNFIQSDASWTPKHPACESILKRISALRKGKDQ